MCEASGTAWCSSSDGRPTGGSAVVDLLVGLVVCAAVAWVVCVPLAKLTGNYEPTRFDNEHGNVHVPTTARRRARR